MTDEDEIPVDDGYDRHESLAMFANHSEEYVRHKISKYGHIRCEKCWLDVKQKRCICASLRIIPFHRNFKFIIYMDHKEYLNPGDDAKLLLCTAPEQTNLFIYTHEDDKLVKLVDEANKTSFVSVLFPGDAALSFEEYCDHIRSEHTLKLENLRFSSYNNENTVSCNNLEGKNENSIANIPMTIIVVDAVWRHARKMSKRLKEILPFVPHVQVHICFCIYISLICE